MKLDKSLWAISFSIALCVPVFAQAAAFGIYDPRSLGMGGVGVTMATARNASFFNPAMLSATRDDDDFALGVPIVAARATDPDKALDDIDALETSGDDLSIALRAFDAAPTAPNATAAASSLSAFSTDLNKVSNKVLDADVFAGAILTIPSKKFGVGVHVSGRVNFGAKFVFAGTDQALISGLATDLNQCAAGNAASCTSARATVDANGQITNLQSRLLVRGLALSEAGLAFARRFGSAGNTDIGITLKAQRIRTYDYAISTQETEIDTSRGERNENSANIDLGIAKAFGESYKVGLVVKNVLRKEFITVLGNKIELKPQARLGVSHHRSWGNIGIDLDLTENKPIAEGFDKETRFVAIGAELDVFSTLQFRLGYRHDLAGNYDGMPSVGLGFSPFGVHIDAAIAGNDKEMAAGIQLGFNF